MEMLKKSKKRIGQNVNSPTGEKSGKIISDFGCFDFKPIICFVFIYAVTFLKK